MKVKYTLRASVHNDFWHHARDKVHHNANREPKARPIMPQLEHIQHIALNIHLPIKVLLMERMHGDLIPSIILLPVLLPVEGQILLNALAREAGLLVLARREGGVARPEGGEDGDGREEGEEDGCLKAAAEFPGEVVGDAAEGCEEQDVVELLAAGPVGGERCIFDGGILWDVVN